MESDEDPYDILGVARDASESEIRTAYRKAALRNHPDKVPEAERENANLLFAKISNAYETLSDRNLREEYDRGRQQQQQQPFNSHAGSGRPFEGDFFPNSFFGQHHHPFHDPFEVFNRVFREEFGGPAASFGRQPYRNNNNNGAASSSSSFPVMDPFFGDVFGGSGFGRGARGGGFGGQDDFFSSSMRQMHDSMRQMQQDFDQHPAANGTNGRNGGRNQYFSSSTSSTTSYGGGGQSVTTQTTRRIVNGQEETVTERIVRHPDGREERTVERFGGGGDDGVTTPAIEPEPPQQQPSRRRLLTGRRKSSKKDNDGNSSR